MRCKKVKDRLITGYLDNALSAKEHAEVEGHLMGCGNCRDFLEAVRADSVIPFKNAGEMQPDGVVWQRIQEGIEAERLRSEPWYGKLADLFVFRMPFSMPLVRVAFVMALILGVVFLAKWPDRYSDPAYSYLTEQMSFMRELSSGNPDLANGDLKDYDVVFEAMGA